MSIAYHISELLHSNDCVIIPEFGGFILNTKPAKINKEDCLIHAPYKSISFNKNIKLNDGLITNKIMAKEGLNFKDANDKINAFSKKMRIDLLNNKLISFPSIGKFYYDIENRLQFIPHHTKNYRIDSFGFQPIQLRKIERPAIKDSVKIIPLHQHEELNKMDLKKATILQFAAILILVFTLVFQHNIFNLSTKDVKSVQMSDISDSFKSLTTEEQEDPIIKNKEEIEEVNKALSEEVESLRKSLDELKNAIQKDSALNKRFYPSSDSTLSKETKDVKDSIEPSLKENPLHIPSPKHEANTPIQINAENFNNIYIVVSAFRIKEKAELTAMNLKKKGYNVNILKTETGWYRVAISNFAGLKQAKGALDKMKKTVNKGSWILAKS